jgi:hypothetical protein
MSLSFAIHMLSLIKFTYGTLLEFYIVSDTTSWIIGPTSGGNAIINPTQSFWNTVISNANWIWDISGNTASGNATVTKYFFIAGTPATGTFTIAADDLYTTYLNDKEANCKDTTGETFSSTTGNTCNVFSYLVSGLNKLVLNVQNNAGDAAVKFRLDVTSSF